MNTPQQLESAFSRYSTTRHIGSGGSGIVLEVTDESGTSFAAKVLSETNLSTTRRKRFKNELAFQERHDHRHIVQVLDHGLHRWAQHSVPFYIMDLYPSTLRERMSRGIAPEQVLAIFGQLLNGIEEAHLRGVWHRDVKPENVLVDKNDVYKIADFGVAHFSAEELATLHETRPGERLANFAYAAPEQRRKGAEVDARADIFALGLILNEMFTGSVPSGTSFPRIGALAPSFAFLDDVVERMIAHDPGQRQSSIAIVKAEISSVSGIWLAKQRVDELSRRVVLQHEVGDPFGGAPPAIAHTDWQDGRLILRLSSTPPPGWAAEFKALRVTHLMGHEPASWDVRGDTVSVVAPESRVLQLRNYATEYVAATNTAFVERQRRDAERGRREEEQRVAKDKADAEQRERILRSLR